MDEIKSLKTNINPPKKAATTTFFIVFYLVGIAGMLLPYSSDFFLKLIPIALVLSFVGLAIFDQSELNKKTIGSLLAIYILSFSVEAIGVNTGLIFGSYEYGNNLGLKISNTPLIIGLNWVFLIYCTATIYEDFKLSTVLKVVLASFTMLLYDIVLEQMAPVLGMWQWQNDIIPFQNYLAWFALALIFHSLLKILKIRFSNKIALTILSCQFLFFLILFVSFKIMN